MLRGKSLISFHGTIQLAAARLHNAAQPALHILLVIRSVSVRLERCLVLIYLVEKEVARIFNRLVSHVLYTSRLLARMLMENANDLSALCFRARLHHDVNFQNNHFALAIFCGPETSSAS